MDRNTLKLNIFSWLLIWTAMVQTTVAGAQNFATPGAALQADLHRADPTYAAHLQYFAQQLAGGSGNTLGHLDMLNTFYNWVVPEAVIHQWYRELDWYLLLNVGMYVRPAAACESVPQQKIFSFQ